MKFYADSSNIDFRTKLDEQKQKKNNILYPETEKTIEDEMSEMFEDDRPKSME